MSQIEYIIVAGGTGGHIFPAVALYEELLKNQKSVQFVTDQRGVSYLEEYKNKLVVLTLTQFKKTPLALYKALSLAYFAFIKMLMFILKNKPHTIIAFGGYPCFPVVLAAAILGKKIILHEQNAVMGRMNRFASRFASKILLGFKETQLIPEKAVTKAEFFGNPVRKKILEIMNKKITSTSFTLLVIGGSQAASIFSEIIPEALKIIKSKLPQNFKIIQQCRNKEEYNKLNNFYAIEGIEAEIAEFFRDIEVKLHQADIVVSRSGASSISEIVALKKPAILVPLPYAMDNHQYFNAKFLSDQKAAMLIEQKELNSKLLSEKLLELFDEANRKKIPEAFNHNKNFIIYPDFKKII